MGVVQFISRTVGLQYGLWWALTVLLECLLHVNRNVTDLTNASEFGCAIVSHSRETSQPSGAGYVYNMSVVVI